MVKKVPFSSCARIKMKKEVCWSAIRSDSQKLVDTQKLVAHLDFSNDLDLIRGKILSQEGSTKFFCAILSMPTSSVVFMSPVSPVFHTVVTVSIGLKKVPRVRAFIL